MKTATLSIVAAGLCIFANPPTASAGIPAPVRAQLPAADQPSHDKPELLFLSVKINGVLQDGVFLIAHRAKDFFILPADLINWGILTVPAATATIENERFVPLSALTGLSCQFDSAIQNIALDVPTERFKQQKLYAQTTRWRPTESAPAAFINYDLSLQYNTRMHAALFLEGGISDDWGLITSTLAIDHRAGMGILTRLDSYYLRDNPDNLTRLVVGDTVTDSLDWSRQSRFGGIRWGTEFSLQPNLVTFPTPAFVGSAVIPSNVELLVDNVKSFQSSVSPGPFSINNLPLVNGAGDVTLVIRDALGVERRVTSSYYVSTRLLAKGLSAWSLEAGAERNNYDVANFSYRNPFAAVSYRRGLTDELTVESRTELNGNVQMAGADLNFVLASWAEFGVAGAISHSRNGNGALYQVFVRRITPQWNISASYQRASRNFNQLGVDGDNERIVRQLQASAGVVLGHLGNIGVVYTDLEYGNLNRSRIATATYNTVLHHWASISLFALRTVVRGSRTETTFGTGITIPFGSRKSGYVQADNRNFFAETHEAPPADGGLGYRFSAGAGQNNRQEAQILWRGDAGEASIDASRVGGETGVQILASGGVLIADNRAYPTRRVEDAVGVVDVPDLANVRIYQENRLVARTDSEGHAIIPDLRAYEQNRIALAPSDIPISDQLPGDTLMVVPRYRGAAKIGFSIKHDHPATIIVQMPNGIMVDAGTTIQTSTGESAFAGFGGEIFVTDAKPGMTIKFKTQNGVCKLILPALSGDEALPRIGPLRCSYETKTS